MDGQDVHIDGNSHAGVRPDITIGLKLRNVYLVNILAPNVFHRHSVMTEVTAEDILTTIILVKIVLLGCICLGYVQIVPAILGCVLHVLILALLVGIQEGIAILVDGDLKRDILIIEGMGLDMGIVIVWMGSMKKTRNVNLVNCPV